jgi:hypothetical protein
MFGIFIFGLNLTNTTARWFDISLTQDYYSPVLNVINSTNIPLSPCTDSHFSMDPNILNSFKQHSNSSWLCPPKNAIINLQGKISTDIYSVLTLTISKCNTTLHANCVPNAKIAAI